LASSFIVSSKAYTNSVYPLDPKDPFKVVEVTHTETKQVKTVTTENKINATVATIFGALSGICLGIAIGVLVMWHKSKDQSALDRNNEAQNALI
jgi:hypothetical protein